MASTKRTDSTDKDFIDLVKLLDVELAERDGSEHTFYAQFNKIDLIKHVVIVYEKQTAVGCGAMKEFNSNSMEVKRMYTLPDYRGKGIASKVLNELELWTLELPQYDRLVLETGKRQPEAIALYNKNGFRSISNYGQYVGLENSICFEKVIIKK